ncbi:helix-turn-helix domain-containing protein, partial [bacterium]|nr:helix-turn-helix domain-containing protein [bacterium]
MEEKLERIVYTCDEAALLLGISRPQIYLGIEREEIPHIRVGKRILIPRAALDKMLENAGAPV